MPPITFRGLHTARPKQTCPECYYLQVEEANILLDCGTWENGQCEGDGSSGGIDEEAFISRLEEIAPTLTLILLSNPTPSSLGLLPLLVNHLKLPVTCQIYASPPTISLGRLALREWASHLCLESDPGLSSSTVRSTADQLDQAKKRAGWKFSPTQLSKTLSRLTAIRFSSPLLLSGRNAPLTLIAKKAGHTLGGTIWTLRLPTNEEITYAPVWNHVKERTLDGATNSLFIPSSASSSSSIRRQKGLLLLGASRSTATAPKTSTKNKFFLELVTNTLQNAHSILIPCDASARLIELLVLLDQHWSYSQLSSLYPLILVSRTGQDLLLALKNNYEFFGSNFKLAAQSQSAESSDQEPSFTLANVKIFTSIVEYQKVYPPSVLGPARLVLSVPSTLSYGFSRILFPDFAKHSGNLVLLCQPSEQGSLASLLFNEWQSKQDQDESWCNPSAKIGKPVPLQNQEIELVLHKKVLLEGTELKEYAAKQAEEAANKAKQKALSDRTRRFRQAKEDQADDSDDDDDDSALDSDDASSSNDDDSPMKDITNGRRRKTKSSLAAAAAAKDGVDAEGSYPSAGMYDEFIDQDHQASVTAAAGSFDIYIRNQVRSEFTLPIKRKVVLQTTTTTQDGDDTEKDEIYFPPLREQPRLRMFPFVERRRKVDAYGEVIDVNAWLSRGKTESNQDEQNVLGKRKRDEEQHVKEKVEPPHRFITETVKVTMACSVFVIDMEGKADGRATKTLLPHLNPQKLILIGADEENTQDLAQACRANTSLTKELFTPGCNQEIQVGDETKSFSIRLEDALMGSLKLKRVDDYDIVRLRGAIHLPDVSSIPTLTTSQYLAEMAENQASAAASAARKAPSALSLMKPLPGDDVIEAEEESLDDDNNQFLLPPLPRTLFIVDIRLFALRQQLNALGIPSAFAGEGVLVCGPISKKAAIVEQQKQRFSSSVVAVKARDTPEVEIDTSGGQVAVRKSRAGELAIEGNPGSTFYAVRNVIYNLHAAAE